MAALHEIVRPMMTYSQTKDPFYVILLAPDTSAVFFLIKVSANSTITMW